MYEIFHYNLQYLKTVYNVWNVSLQFTILKTVYNVWNVPL